MSIIRLSLVAHVEIPVPGRRNDLCIYAQMNQELSAEVSARLLEVRQQNLTSFTLRGRVYEMDRWHVSIDDDNLTASVRVKTKYVNYAELLALGWEPSQTTAEIIRRELEAAEKGKKTGRKKAADDNDENDD